MGKRSTYITVKPWGTEELWATTHHSVGKILTIKGGHRLSRKYHRIKNHTIRILEGSLTLEVGPLKPGAPVETLTLRPGEVCYLEAMTIHRLCANEEGVTLVEISNQGARDSVRLEDDYRRITKIPDRGPHSSK
jgi:mannose-6-phosphate isomerase-like protein (cupin superfamily)